MKRIIYILIIVLLVLVGCNENAGTNTSTELDPELKDLQTKLDDVFMQKYESKGFNGMALIAEGDTIILEKSYGMADVENETEFTDLTKFDIASITKQFTSVAIMQLQEKGLLNVEDTLDKYLPNFPNGDKIIIHNLLTHTAALPQTPDAFDITQYKPSNYNADIEIDSDKPKLIGEPDKSFYYSNVGYILLGYVVESITNKELDEYLKENIFDVANMNNTGFKDKNYNIDNLATGYSNFNYEKAGMPSPYDESVSPVRGSAGLCTTLNDLYSWNKALFSGKIISLKTLEKMHTPYKGQYGYGWFILGTGDKKVVWHDGFANGYRSYIAYKPSENKSIIFISNINDSKIKLISLSLNRLFFSK